MNDPGTMFIKQCLPHAKHGAVVVGLGGAAESAPAAAGDRNQLAIGRGEEDGEAEEGKRRGRGVG